MPGRADTRRIATDAVSGSFVPEWNRALGAARDVHENRLSNQGAAGIRLESDHGDGLAIRRPGRVDARALPAWSREHSERQELRGDGSRPR